MKKLSFSIEVTPFGAKAAKDVSRFTGELRASDKAVENLKKNITKTVGNSKRGMEDLAVSAGRTTNILALGFDKATSSVDKFNRKIVHGTKEAFEKVKEHLSESFKGFQRRMGERAFDFVSEIPKRIFEAGSGDIRARQRASREFGTDAETLFALSKRAGGRSGLDDSEALTALFPVAESISTVQKGTKFKGKSLSDRQAEKLRENLYDYSFDLFSRITTVTGAKGEEAEQIGYLLANAGTGPEGMRGLVSALHLNKARSSQVMKANEKSGGLYKLLGKDKAKEFGVGVSGMAGQGTVLDILLSQSGITEKAAEEERSKFGFQIKSIGATFESALGDVGSKTLDKITSGFGKGATLAERFKKAIESKEGERVINGIADGISRAATFAITLGREIPKVINFVEANKGKLEIAALAYGGLSVARPVGGAVIGGVRGASAVLNAVRGGGGGLAGLLATRGSSPASPLYVSAVGGVGGASGVPSSAALAGLASGIGLALAGALAAYGGYQAGNYLGKHVAPIGKAHDWLANGLYGLTGERDADKKLETFGIARNNAQLAQRAQAREALERQLEGAGYNHGQAVYLSEHQSEIKRNESGGIQQINLVLDGKIVAQVVNKHNARGAKNATAGIAQ